MTKFTAEFAIQAEQYQTSTSAASSKSVSTSSPFYIGVDGGGTKCRVRLEDAAGHCLGEGVAGSANIMRDTDVAKASMLEAISNAISQSGQSISLSDCVVGAGLAGANIPAAHARILQWQHPFKAFYVISDLHAACIGAHEGQEGSVIIVGTGSTGAHYKQGHFYELGGHGFPIGDKASGAWMGLKAIQHTLEVIDGLAHKDKLADAVIGQFSIDAPHELVQLCGHYTAKEFAEIAPLVVSLANQGVPKAQEILREAANYIQRMAHALLRDNSAPLCLIGGLAQSIGGLLDVTTQQRIKSCAQAPEQGAIHHARYVHSSKETCR
ncbi:ATPase [Aestuariibacter sp. AA17]|uniref:ATPase n=1 Tax=Fluctibacter corallii TaxID=2984329 RepID=A0ABT3A5X6_9ALTE|nr:BadF/BadG/BcrA/BcrD ATPase family protein [Aestuariibacter sp. AA17]MCV2883756.1 ATPase [Aestuariibacter sp. AA17]